MAGRIRTIKPELLEDEVASSLSDSAWRLFVSSWLLADDHGNFRAGRRYLAASVWQDTTKDADAPLAELAKAGRVLLYEVDGQRYATIPNWKRHQRIDNASKPRVPIPPENIREVSDRFAASLGESPRTSESLGTSRLDHGRGRGRSRGRDHGPALPSISDSAADAAAQVSTSTVPAPKVKRDPKPKPEAPPPHPRHGEVVAAYFESFERVRGTKPVFDGKDGKHVKTLLEKLSGDADRAIAVIRGAFNGDPFLARAATIETIARDPSKYLGSKAPPQGRPPWKPPVQPMSDAWAPNTGEYEDLPEGRIF